MISTLQTVILIAAVTNFLLMCYYGFQGFLIRRTMGPRVFLSVAGFGILMFLSSGYIIAGAPEPDLLVQLFRLQLAGCVIAIAAWMVALYLFLIPEKNIPLYTIFAAVVFLVLTPGSILISPVVKNHMLVIGGIDFSFTTSTPTTGIIIMVIVFTFGSFLGLFRIFTCGNGYKKKTLGTIMLLPGIIGAVHALVFATSMYYIHVVCITTLVLLMGMSLVFLFDDRRQYSELYSMYTQLQQDIHEQHDLIDDLNNELLNTSIYDSVTGLYNRKELYDRMTSELSRAIRHNRDLILIYIDLDNFGYYNNEYGHYAGDYILKEFGQILINITRKADCVARFGSDEFMLLLPETNIEGALKVLENIWAVVGTKNGFASGLSDFLQRPVKVPRDNYLDFCAGLNCISCDHKSVSSIEDLVVQTRSALDSAKRIGCGNYAIFGTKTIT